MNILMIAGRVPSAPLDGGSMRVFHLAQEWGRRHHVTILAPQIGLSSSPLPMLAQVHTVPVRIAQPVERVSAYLVRISRREPTVDLFPELLESLRALVKKQRFDVVELEGSGAGLYLPALADLTPRPQTVLVFYDVMWDWWRREFSLSPRPISLARWLSYRVWEPRLVRQVDACVFMSEVDSARVSKIVKPKRTFIVPNGIHIESLDCRDVPDTSEILFVGNLGHSPNRQAVSWLAKEIVPAVKRRAPTAHFTVVGRDPPPYLTTMTNAAGITLVPNAPDVRPYYERARAVIVPIQSGGGIRVKILEALAAGRPVVTTSLGAEGLPLIPGEHVLIADDVEGLADASARLLSDRSLAERLAANGRALVEREYNWKLLASKQESAFRVGK